MLYHVRADGQLLNSFSYLISLHPLTMKAIVYDRVNDGLACGYDRSIGTRGSRSLRAVPDVPLVRS